MRGVVAAEEIVLPAESKRPDGILDEVVVDVDPAVVHVARQTGKKTVDIGKGLSEPALGQDLRIGLLNPLLEHQDYRIGYLTALLHASTSRTSGLWDRISSGVVPYALPRSGLYRPHRSPPCTVFL